MGSYDLTTNGEVFAWLGDDAQRPAFWTYFSGTSGTNTIEVNDNSVVLIDEDNGTSTFDITSTSYDTLTELVAGINAKSGWSAGLIYTGSADSADLIITGALNAEGKANEQTLMIKDTYLIGKLIERATDFLERYCNRKLYTRSYTKEAYDGNGYDRLILEQYPVTMVSRVAIGRTNAFSVKNTSGTTHAFFEITSSAVKLSVDGATPTSISISTNTVNQLITLIEAQTGWDCTLLNSDYGSYLASELLVRPAMYSLSPQLAYAEIPNDYITDFHLETGGGDEFRNPGILYYPGGFDEGHQNVFLWYTAGYTTIPSSLEEACIRLVALAYNSSKIDPLMRSEKKADYSYTRADFKEAIPPELKAEIDLFKRRII